MSQLDIFFNTTSLKGNDLKLAINSASSQNDKILIFLERNKGISFTPSQVHSEIFEENTPITSIRRSLTVLTKLGKLIKTDKQAIGIYGSPEYKWTFKF